MVVESGFDFWGATLMPGKVIKCTVSDALLHITSIALDETITNSKERTVVSVGQGDRRFVIASLREGVCEHVSVDLLFRENEEFKFKCNGSTPVHLVGYVQPMAEDDDDMEKDEDFVPSEDEEEEDEPLESVEADDDEASVGSDEQEEEELPKASISGNKRDVADLSSSDEESESDDGSDEEEKPQAPPSKKQKQQPKQQQETPKQQPKQQQETPKKQPKQQQETPKQQPKQQQETPKKQPKQQQETPKQQPKQQQETPKKQPKQQQETPKPQQETPKQQQPKKQQDTPKPEGKPEFRKLPGGLMVCDVVTGHGKEAKSGKVSVFYTGRLKNGKVFDSNANSNKPFRFNLGRGEVIKGWDIGVKGMKVGGKRKLIIPAKLGYGKAGAGSDIPPNSVLIFDVELARC